MRIQTAIARRRLYELSRGAVAREYRRRLTLEVLAKALSSSPREIQRAYAQFGALTFAEDLRARRLVAAAQLLREQPALAVADVARLVGYRGGAHFARAFGRRFGLAPARFRARARTPGAGSWASGENGGDASFGGCRGARGGGAR